MNHSETHDSNIKPRLKHNKISIRLIVQVVFFLLLALFAVNRYLDAQGSSISWLSTASIHALCPFGGVVSIYTALTDGILVKKIHESSMVLMYIILGMSLFFGPVFCGWICPVGSFQEWIGKIGKAIFKRRYNRMLPAWLDKKLRYLRYVVLALVIYLTATSVVLVFQAYDPYFALFNFWSGEVALSALIVLGVTTLLSLLVERPFCKYACPYGALLGVFNLFRIFGIKRNKDTCIDCHKCDRSCPMNIEVSKTGTIRDHQCISCLKCTSEQACPVPQTVEMRLGKMQVNKNENK
jgi:polyferredoxin